MMMTTKPRYRNALSYDFAFELPYVGLYEAKNRLWMRLIHKYGHESVMRHRTALHTAVTNIHNEYGRQKAKP